MVARFTYFIVFLMNYPEKERSIVFFTVKSYAKASFIERHSEFIGHITPVSTNDEAVAFINKIRAEHRKATHNVYAYILRNDNIIRYSDDGEPQGTAGVPVLDVLQKRQLTDVCCVITRYFGGILLGGGGLVRAYSHSAGIVTDTAQILNMFKCFHLILTMDYSLFGKVSYILPEFQVKQVSSDFGDIVRLNILVKKDVTDNFIKKLTDITNSRIEIIKLKETFEDFS